MCWFSGVALMKYYKLGSLKQHKSIVSQSWRLGVQKSRCWQGLAPSENYRESFFVSS